MKNKAHSKSLTRIKVNNLKDDDAQTIAQRLKARHDEYMKGKKTELVKHPTLPNTWIERIIN